MTDDRSIDRHDFDPGACPECGNVNIEGHAVDIEGQEARQEVSCGDCDSVWVDVYRIDRRYICQGDGPLLDYTLFVKDSTP